MRHFATSIRFGYFFICKKEKQLQNYEFFCLNSLCVLISLQNQAAFTVRYFSASNLFLFVFICNARELLKRDISLPQFSL